MSKIEELQKKIDELQKELNVEMEKRKEVECPFEDDDSYYLLTDAGSISEEKWENYGVETAAWSQGNIFSTEEQATLARDRRILLTKFNSFRDKCNGDWKADFKMHNENKYALFLTGNNCNFFVDASTTFNHFHLFGYFKDKEDAALAIELFGDEIRRLYVEVE